MTVLCIIFVNPYSEVEINVLTLMKKKLKKIFLRNKRIYNYNI